MPMWYPDEGSEHDPLWWRALEQVALLTRQSETLPSIAACEFMFMGRWDRRGRPPIWLYKHIWTRSYLNIDEGGHAFRYIAPRDFMNGSGRYVAHRGLRIALEHLELEFAPDSWRAERRIGCELCDPLTEAPLGDPGGACPSA